MELWISGGGTGGHVYPALTVLDALGPRAERVTWLGRPAGLERELVAARGLDYLALPSGPLVGSGPLRALRSAAAIAHGAARAWRAMGRRRPDVLLATGGYVSVPGALAARARGVPLAVYLPDMRPGRAVSLIARIADRVLVTDAGARAALPRGARVEATGYPVRPSVRAATRGPARSRLGLPEAEALLLVYGGSQGARSLNEAVWAALPTLAERAVVLHQTGPASADEAAARRDALPAELRTRYRPTAYLHDEDMAAALAAADLALCRAGASTLGELAVQGLPALLVPLPIAEGHQDANAARLVEAGAARLLPDAELDGPRLLAEAEAILGDPALRARMSTAARALDPGDAAEAIGRALLSLAGEAA